MPTGIFHEFSRQRRKMILIHKTIGFTINLMSFVSPKLAGKLALTIFSTPVTAVINRMGISEVIVFFFIFIYLVN